MKKLAIGCGAVLLVLAVGAGIAGYYIYSKAKSYLSQFEAIAAVEKNVANRAPFTPPAASRVNPPAGSSGSPPGGAARTRSRGVGARGADRPPPRPPVDSAGHPGPHPASAALYAIIPS